jgi:hypothetical protein
VALPLFKSEDQAVQLMQAKWKSELDPILSLPFLSGLLIKDVDLINGVTVVNHRLGRKLQGWFIVDVDAGVDIYRSAPLNDRTLTLTSGADCTVSLWVF